MDILGISIIIISILLALVFKFVLVKRIHSWIDHDLIKSLAKGDGTRLAQLKEFNAMLQAQNLSRKERHSRLENRASELQAVDSE